MMRNTKQIKTESNLNYKLFEDILSSDINDAVISNLRKYVNSNFRIKIDFLQILYIT